MTYVQFTDEYYSKLEKMGKRSVNPMGTALADLISNVRQRAGVVDTYQNKMLTNISIMAHLDGREFTLYAVGDWSGPESMEHFIIARESLTARSAFEARSYALEFEALLKDVPREYEVPLRQEEMLPSMEGILSSHRVESSEQLHDLESAGHRRVNERQHALRLMEELTSQVDD